jgi:hypothetical protein
LIAQEFDGSKYRSYPGRPPVKNEIVELLVKMAKEIPAGATIGSSARWPILGTFLGSNGGQCSSPPWNCASASP